MNDKGQAILAEHVMVFFIVVAALTAMTVLVRRAFEARIHDARNFAIEMAANACDVNCQAASNGVSWGYEPYYMQTFSDVQRNSDNHQGITNGSAGELGAIYISSVNDTSNISSISHQLPPVCSSSNPPPCCSDGTGCAT